MVLRFFILAVFLFMSCADGERNNPYDPGSDNYVPWGSSSSVSVKNYCVYAETQQCYFGLYTACPGIGGVLEDACPYSSSATASSSSQNQSSSSVLPEYGYCVFISDKMCLTGPLTDCPPGGTLSNSCPYGSSSSQPSSSSVLPSSSSSLAPSSSSSAVSSSSSRVSSSSSVPPSSSSAVPSSSSFAFELDPCSQTTALSNPARTITSNGTGNLSGSGSTQMHYEMWAEGGNNNKMMWFGADKGGGAAFRAEWNNPNDFLGLIGYYWGNGGKYSTYKNIYVDYNYTRSGRSTAGDYSYIGIYGWTKNPLVEYYIVEDWFGNQWQADTSPVGTSIIGGSEQGSFTVDGATYKVIKMTRTNAPSIVGNSTFDQYFSIRQTQRKCGTISVTEHFKQWEKMGMSMGNMYEAKFLVEAGGGTGWFDASYIKFSQEDQPRW